MPCILNWEEKGVYVRFLGTCTVTDVIRALEQIGGDARSDDIYFAIFDYLEIDSQNVTEAETEEIAAMDIGMAYSVPRLRFASVSIDERVLALWRHFISAHAIPERHGIFSTLKAARDWVVAIESEPGPTQLHRLR